MHSPSGSPLFPTLSDVNLRTFLNYSALDNNIKLDVFLINNVECLIISWMNETEVEHNKNKIRRKASSVARVKEI